ncbi:MAG: tetratricopeptide repeat protein [Acidobacteria bacterium]|nr:tetratricopeptide repeat protein [Acidobacteriota bacterium]
MKNILALLLFAFALCAASFGQTTAERRQASEIFKQATNDYNRGQYDLAISKYTSYLKIRPNIAAAWYNRGLACYQKGSDFTSGDTKTIQANIDRAVSDFTEAIRLDPSSPDYYTYRGLACSVVFTLDTKKYASLAISDFSEAIRLQPKSSENYRRRGDMYDATFRSELALADYTKSISLNNKNVSAYLGRGKAYSSKQNNKLAKADFETALRLDPQNSMALSLLAAFKVESDSGIKTPGAPGTWKTLSEQGNVYFGRREFDKAIVSFQRAIRLIPKQTKANITSILIMRDRSLLLEKVARSYFAKNDFQNTIDNYASAHSDLINIFLETLGKDPGIRSPILEVQSAAVEGYIGPAIDLAEIGKRGMNTFTIASLTADQKRLFLKMATIKLASATTASKILHLASMIRLSLAKACKAEKFSGCGERSSKNLIPTHTSKSLGFINKAIEFSPFMKILYLQRAEIYRFMGKSDLAQADSLKANQLKDN